MDTPCVQRGTLVHMTVVAITGHRPEKLKNLGWIDSELSRVLIKLNTTLLYQGMAAGVDLMSATIAKRLDIPYVAARPWAGHTPRQQDQDRYAVVLNQAQSVVNVSPETNYLGPWQYHQRNEYMVDHADIVVAVWDGDPKGGTAACVRYAQKKGLDVVRLDPKRQLTTIIKAKQELAQD
jgi:uncharacterized phage-like protein YoqJ